jgi:MGT family glycosyltransferase
MERTLGSINRGRELFGLQPLVLPDPPVWPSIPLLARCQRSLVVVPHEFEDPDLEPPVNARYVGPVFEEGDQYVPWDLPWPPDHPDPLVVVSFSSTYMHHEPVLGRVLAALDGLPVRILVTLGRVLDPGEVPAPAGVVVRRHVPHVAVMAHAALVVTHAGMGTVMAAFAYGVPLLCLPMGRDQEGNAERVAALGAGKTINQEASVEEVRAAVGDALRSDTIRVGARRMADVVASYGHGARAIAELEALLDHPRSA